MTTGDAPRRENALTLVRRLISGGVALAKLEVQRGRQEMARNLVQLRGGIVKIAIGVAILVTVLIMLVAFVIALLVMAGLLAWSGVKDVQSTNFTPEETIASVKEEIEWAKSRLLRRG